MQTTTYQVIDRHTQTVVGTHKTRAAASRSVNRKDNLYGAYRYFVKPVSA